ncbi:MAG: hypothetical protein KKA36_08745 [Gammaproteobacteria bacterium]|nr:hypothetical protein [Gammaproteobacteria bacterium]MBU2479163.1 hypothetical protein [Gammaproteobacteria bacterium]
MITFSLFAFLAILEGMVFMLIVIGVLVWRLRKQRARDRLTYIDGSDAHPTPALYLESEVAKTRTHLEALTAAPAGQADVIADPVQTALTLRAALLDVEAELSKNLPEKRDLAFWQGLADRLGAVLIATGYNRGSTSVSEAKTPEAKKMFHSQGYEEASIVGLLEQQSKTIDYLRNYIQKLLDQHGHQPSPEPDIADNFVELERANKELSNCVAVLEDENEFLREQISALLKM